MAAPPVDPDRLTRALAAIDEANAQDPHTLVVDGVARPKEQWHAELMTAWVQRLDPDADEAQLLAARAHHLRRWEVPRSDYPAGRVGYRRWRTAQQARHARQVGQILGECGYGSSTIDRVGQIIRKEGLGHDPAVQAHEDALCLVFLATQLEGLGAQLGEARSEEVLARTLAKMSPSGRGQIAALGLDPAGTELVARASLLMPGAGGPM